MRHGSDIFLLLLPGIVHGGEQRLRSHHFLFEDAGIALFLKGAGIQDLVSAARVGRERDQDVRLLQGQDLADGVRAGPADHDVRQGKEVLQVVGDVLILEIMFRVLQALVHISLSAEVQHGEFLQELRQGGPHGLIYCAGSQASADHHQHRPVLGKAGQLKTAFPGAGQELCADRGAGHQGLVLREILQGLREVAADGFCGAVGQLVRQARGHVGFVDHHRDMAQTGSPDHGHGNIAAFGEDDVRRKFFDDFRCFPEALQDPERIGEVLQVKISPQLSGGNAPVFDPFAFDQLLLDSIVGADVQDLESCSPESGKQGNVRRDVTGSTAAGKNDFRHGMTSIAAVLCYIMREYPPVRTVE